MKSFITFFENVDFLIILQRRAMCSKDENAIKVSE